MNSSEKMTSRAIVGLFVLALFYTLYFARVFLLPLVLALLLTFLLKPVVGFLLKLRIPQAIGAAVVTVCLVGIMGFGVMHLSQPASEWIQKAPRSIQSVERKIRKIRRSFERVQETAEEIEKITELEDRKAPEVRIKEPSLSDLFFRGTRQIFVMGAVMLVLMYFLLAFGNVFSQRVVALLLDSHKKEEALKIVSDAEHSVSRYLFTIVVINTVLGFAIAGAMYLLGLPNPALWGVMAGLVNFIPYIGAMAGVVTVALVAFLTFDSLGRILAVPAVYFLITSLEGQVITPIILGSRFRMSPVVIFLWLVFWGWLWGVAGALVAVPMLTVLKIFSGHMPFLYPVGRFLDRD